MPPYISGGRGIFIPLLFLHTSFFRSNGQTCRDCLALEMGLNDRRGGGESRRPNLGGLGVGSVMVHNKNTAKPY